MREPQEELNTLRWENERYRIAAGNSSEIIVDYDIEKNSIYHVTSKSKEIYGLPEFLERAPRYLVEHGVILPESAKNFYEMFQKIKDGEPYVSCAIQTRTKCGRVRWGKFSFTTVFGPEGKPVRAIGVLKDITRQREAEMRLKKAQLYRNVIKKCAILSCEVDLTHAAVLIGFDKIACKLGRKNTKDYNKDLELLVNRFIWPEDRDLIFRDFSRDNLLMQFHLGRDKVDGEYRRELNGEASWIRCTAYLISDRQMGIVRAFFHVYDIHESKLEALNLREQAETDLMTGIYNRETVEALITHALMEETNEGCFHALIIVDVDDFESVNDKLGHAFGDVVLYEMAQNLKALCRNDDIVGRIGGEEFVLFLRNMPDYEIVKFKGRDICTMFHNAYAGVLKDHKVSGTAGIAVSPNNGKTFEELYRNADTALHQAKQWGKDTYCIFGIDDSHDVSEEMAKEETLSEHNGTCRPNYIYIIDINTYQLKFVSQSIRTLIPAAVPGAVCYQVICGKHNPCQDCPFARMKDGQTEYRTKLHLDPYGFWGQVEACVIESEHRKFGHISIYDLRENKSQVSSVDARVDAFTRDLSLYRVLCHSTDDYIFMYDLINDLYYLPDSMVYEFDLPGKVIPKGTELLASMVHDSERNEFLKCMEDILKGKRTYHNLEYRVRNRDGGWVWLRCRGHVETNEDGAPSLFTGMITNLGRKSKIDYLSGLPNKYEFEQKVRSKLADGQISGELLLLGLDNFRNINNLYGWEFGDRVIHETAQKIQGFLPDNLQVYRLDGDCFGILFDESSRIRVQDIYQIIFCIFKNQQQCGEHRYYCTISGGYSVYGEAPISFNTLFKQAEFALEYSKIEGKSRLSRYSASIMGDRERILSMMESLRESVDQDCSGFELFFQPQILTSPRQIKSAEVLLRWRNIRFGLVSPTEFIPLLEQTGLIQEVGRWVLLRAVEICREWRKKIPDFILNVNVSYAQLQDQTFIPYLENAIRQGLIEPDRIHLELTESCIAAGSVSLISAFEKLRKLGFCIEMDDFGTGYSSLEILKNAPADVVKIDRAFVMDITKSDFDATFIEFVVALCHSVNIQVCLEGVETWDEYRMVESMSVDLIQGYLFGRPQCKHDFESRYLNKGVTQFPSTKKKT